MNSHATTGIAAWKTPCLVAGVVGSLVCAAGAVVQPGAFWPGYLVAWLFWLGISVGGLGIALLHRLTGGRWGWSSSRPLVAAAGVMPLIAILFLPFVAGAAALYPFASSEAQALLNPHQQSYFELPFFYGRSAGYFAVWVVASIAVTHVYRRDGAGGMVGSGARKAAFGLVLVWLAATFAVFDWLMSLEPGWYSTIYGALHILGFAVEAFSFAIIARHFAGGPGVNSADSRTQDLGSMLLAFTMLWTYLAFSQWLIVWSGDLPEQNSWYLHRSQGAWAIAAPVLIVADFALPLALLLSRDIKGSSRRLAGVAWLLLAARLLDLTWSVVPACPEAGLMTVVYGLAALIGVGGLWLFDFGRRWNRLAMLTEPLPAPGVNSKSAPSSEAAT